MLCESLMNLQRILSGLYNDFTNRTGVYKVVIGDWTQDSEVAPSQTSSGNSAANAASTTIITVRGQVYGKIVILGMHYSCLKVRKAVWHWNSLCMGRISLGHGPVY